ncbi:permeability factor 2-like [Parambassis ranga]|uniref:Permeability factor 2-like n=1 Tax=Parambassis ranga TaxID=210632 RepID=A0A6P7KCU2_9TELE|nr:permeability factor 2-like [Parambassis ranga]
MKALTQCIILLACVALSTSAAILNCRCLKTIQGLPYELITDVEVREPRPYCNKREVIVTLEDDTQRCLNPEGKFTRAVLQKQKKARADKTSTSSPTTAPTTATSTSS